MPVDSWQKALVFGTAICLVVCFAKPLPSNAETVQFSVSSPKATYLSSQMAMSKVSIANDTADIVSFSAYSVRFLIRGDDGRTTERPMITTITNIFGPAKILAGGHLDFSLTLPSCKVVSDPCTQHVAVKLGIEQLASTQSDRRIEELHSRELTYTFVPDPNATFDLDRLNDKNPVFLTQGDGEQAERQSQRLSTFIGSGIVGNPNVIEEGTQAYVGDRAAPEFPAALPNLRADAYLGTQGRSEFSGRVPIAADRPEVLAIGRIDEHEADRFGMRTTEAASEIAAAYLKAFETDLGVSLGPISLVAVEPEPFASAETDIQTSYVARPVIGTMDSIWQPFVAAPKFVVTPTPAGLALAVPPSIVLPPQTLSISSIPVTLENEDRQIVARADADMTFTAVVAPLNCSRLIDDARKRSIEEAIGSAITSARLAGKTLRHLVLASAEAPMLQPADACRSESQSIGSLEVHAPVELRFRTF